jgi:histidine ammonia-lyase
METLKRFWNWLILSIKKGWNWLLGQTTIDEKVVDTYNEVKDRVEAVKEQIQDVKEAVEDVIEEAKDVVEAAKGSLIEGKVTKSKLNALKKSDLLQHAKDEFGKEFDSKITKSNLVNKIYSLHKGK